MQGDGLHSSRFPPYVFGGSGRCPCRRGVPGPIRGFPFGTGRAYGLFPWYLFWIGGCPWDIWLQRQKEAEKERKYPKTVDDMPKRCYNKGRSWFYMQGQCHQKKNPGYRNTGFAKPVVQWFGF